MQGMHDMQDRRIMHWQEATSKRADTRHDHVRNMSCIMMCTGGSAAGRSRMTCMVKMIQSLRTPCGEKDRTYLRV